MTPSTLLNLARFAYKDVEWTTTLAELLVRVVRKV